MTKKPSTWPGQLWGVRAPMADETPLSWDEVIILARLINGVTDA